MCVSYVCVPSLPRCLCSQHPPTFVAACLAFPLPLSQGRQPGAPDPRISQQRNRRNRCFGIDLLTCAALCGLRLAWASEGVPGRWLSVCLFSCARACVAAAAHRAVLPSPSIRVLWSAFIHRWLTCSTLRFSPISPQRRRSATETVSSRSSVCVVVFVFVFVFFASVTVSLFWSFSVFVAVCSFAHPCVLVCACACRGVFCLSPCLFCSLPACCPPSLSFYPVASLFDFVLISHVSRI